MRRLFYFVAATICRNLFFHSTTCIASRPLRHCDVNLPLHTNTPPPPPPPLPFLSHRRRDVEITTPYFDFLSIDRAQDKVIASGGVSEQPSQLLRDPSSGFFWLSMAPLLELHAQKYYNALCTGAKLKEAQELKRTSHIMASDLSLDLRKRLQAAKLEAKVSPVCSL
jgi:hypothetical protein